MSFFGGDKEQDQPKKRSTLGLLFNPEIGKEVKPLGEAFAIFPRLIAMVFSSYRLFPKDHPAFGDMSMRLTLREVIGTAYSRLQFTREGIPQIVLFAAVVGMLAIGVLTLLTIVMSLFVGNAHAQSMFQSPNPSTDYAENWLDYLFYGKDLSMNLGTTGSTTSSCTIQPTLTKALAFYSNAILVLAGIILMYHLGSMIAETAHTGQAMGKRANQIWAPIRLVVAIGLLIPVGSGGSSGSSCSVSGYNLGQYLAITVARMGSGLASNVWNMFASNLSSSSTVSACANGSNSPACVIARSDVVSLVSAAMVSDACAKLNNYYLSQGDFDPSVYEIIGLTTFSGGKTMPGKTYYFGYGGIDSALKGIGRFLGGDGMTTEDAAKICGGYMVPVAAGTTGIYDQLAQTQLEAFDALRIKIDQFNKTYVPKIVDGGHDPKAAEAAVKEYKEIVDKFKDDLNNKIKATWPTIEAAEKAERNTYLNGKNFSDTGWLMAGAWFNTISRMQAQRANALHHALPVPISPIAAMLQDASAGDEKTKMKGPRETARIDLKAYQNMIGRMNDTYVEQYNNDLSDRNQAMAMLGTEKPDKSVMKALLQAANPIELLLQLVDKGAWVAGLWDIDGTLGIKFGASGNPLYEITAFGQNFVSYATTLMGIGATAALAGTTLGAATFTVGFGPIATFVANICVFLAVLFYTIGFSMGFLVPLYPFYRFFFGSLQWLVMAIEAVVSAPLFALAHLNPYGEGLPGQKASYGYAVGTQMILRPVLMVLGLGAGFLLFNAALSFLNFAFEIAARGTGAYGGNAVISKILYTIIYTALVLIMANQCFKTIGLFPQVALKYLAMGPVHEEKFGDPGTLTAAAAYMGKNFMDQTKGAVLAPSKALGAHIKEKQNLAAANTKHNQLLDAIRGSGGGPRGGGGRGPGDVARANQFLSDAGYTGPKRNSPGDYELDSPPPPGQGSADSGAGLMPPVGPGTAPGGGFPGTPSGSGTSPNYPGHTGPRPGSPGSGGSGNTGGGGGNSV